MGVEAGDTLCLRQTLTVLKLAHQAELAVQPQGHFLLLLPSTWLEVCTTTPGLFCLFLFPLSSKYQAQGLTLARRSLHLRIIYCAISSGRWPCAL